MVDLHIIKDQSSEILWRATQRLHYRELIQATRGVQSVWKTREELICRFSQV